MRVRKTAVLGASGLVAQRFQQRLANHPWFELAAVAGSPRTAGKSLSEIEWILPEGRPELPELKILSMDGLIESLAGVEVVFSALPSDIASKVEKPLAAAGFFVFSNASAHRMNDDVPLVIADLNPHHLLPLKIKLSENPQQGFVACSTNCTVIPAALPLKPVWDMIGLRKISITTEQATSGGGLGLLLRAREEGKVEEEIPGEAEKIVEECRSLLGRATAQRNTLANIEVDCTCRRVMREWGHIVHVEAQLSRESNAEEVIEWVSNHRGRAQSLNLPSAPKIPIIIAKNVDTEADRWAGFESDYSDQNPDSTPDPATNLRAGMAVVMSNIVVEGRILRFTGYSANTIRGAAGGTVLLAELAIAEGLLGKN
jgi:aspartate-semialdehyde dehydrogenase